jgi:indolepyruvate ferredoxin oxidoreductase beta subunit
MKLDIVIAGVGGQGTVLASRVLAQAALNHGLSARTSEMIGMAQREGSVQSHVRIGTDFGPVIGRRQADVLIGFEPAEAVRSCSLLKQDGLLLVNDFPIRPVTVALGASGYSLAEIRDFLQGLPAQVRMVNAFELAVQAGNFRTLNSVMLGMLAGTGILPMDRDCLLETLLEMVPGKARDINKTAFLSGCQIK